MLLLPVTFINTQRVISTRALKSWFAEPNSGQMFAYPIFVSTKPKRSVIIVEKYGLQRTLRQGFAFFISSTANSSWKLILPIRATASRLVSASAETHIVINTVAKCTGIPNISKKPATPRLNIWKGVPDAGVPS